MLFRSMRFTRLDHPLAYPALYRLALYEFNFTCFQRDVNTDFLLVVLRDMLATYPDLRVILMSATIDDTLFTTYFNGCPVLTVEGRAFAVQTYFLEDIVEMLQFQPSADSIRYARIDS